MSQMSHQMSHLWNFQRGKWNLDYGIFRLRLIDWCFFYYFVRNRLVALLEALCARKPWCARFPHLKTGSHTHVRQQLCPRPENTPWGHCNRSSQNCPRTTTQHKIPMMKNPPSWPRHEISKCPPPHRTNTKTFLNPSTLKENNWWDSTFYISGTVMGIGGARE